MGDEAGAAPAASCVIDVAQVVLARSRVLQITGKLMVHRAPGCRLLEPCPGEIHTVKGVSARV
jgi:hypothetical protein